MSLEKCDNIHGKIEEEWEDWIVENETQKKLKDILSESERAKKFIKNCFNEKEPNWKNYNYPKESILKSFDEDSEKQFGMTKR